ncbi:choice-of-anchor Q domain-containing protein [Anaerolineales bacterium HSG25]|nr:choice-of-anchor Q domain-containing protein [Anaerolineales bacterium HSG25]
MKSEIKPSNRFVAVSTNLHRAMLSWGLGLLIFAALISSFMPQTTHAQDPVILYVAPSGDDTDNIECSQDQPCATIQHAIDMVVGDEEIRVAASTYATVTINNNLSLKGGYSTLNWDIPDPIANPTKIDGKNTERAVDISSGVVLISGFHIINGTVAGDGGGGVKNAGGTVTLEQNKIYDNSATGAGGGVVNFEGGDMILISNEIYNNSSELIGGGVAIEKETVILRKNKIYGNSAKSAGGGISTNDDSIVTMQNNLIYDNQTTTADQFGGGGLLILNTSGSVTIQHNTFYGNETSNAGGAILVYPTGDGQGSINIINSLIVNNGALTDGGIGFLEGGTIGSISYSDVYDNTPNNDNGISGSNNNTDTPAKSQFVNEANQDFHLTFGARAVDSGTDIGVTDDLDDNVRPFPSGFDRGAYEYLLDSTCFTHLSATQIYTSVQDAVNEASDDAVIKVAGTCTDLFDPVQEGAPQIGLIDKNVTLQGGYSVNDWDTPTYGPTVIDAENSGRAFFINGSGAEVTLENMHVTGGSASNGAGLYVTGDGTLNLVNMVFYSNQATTQGGGIYVDEGRTVNIDHATFYQNQAAEGGAIYSNGAGKISLRNSALVQNSGNALQATNPNRFANDYNGYSGNNPNDFGSNSSAGFNALLNVTPGFENPGSGNFHLDYNSSGLIGQADPASSVPKDMDYDNRPLPAGGRSDIGADESQLYLGLDLGAASNSPLLVDEVQGTTVIFEHTLQNISNIPAGTASFQVTASNSEGWAVQIQVSGARIGESASPEPAEGTGAGSTSSPYVPDQSEIQNLKSPIQNRQSATVELANGESRLIQIVVTVPDPLSAETDNRTIVSATAIDNPAVNQSQTDVIAGSVSQMGPSYDESAKPGEVLTYTHYLTNTAATEDTFVIEFGQSANSRGWGQLITPPPTTPTLTIGPGGVAKIEIAMTVGQSAAEGVQDIMTVIATSQNTQVESKVVNTTTAQATIGTRHVVTTGSDEGNNCTDKTVPCKTVSYALSQTANDDEILIAQGLYEDADLLINQAVSLRGGYTPDFSKQVINPNNTIIDAQGLGRSLRIQNVPSMFELEIEGLAFKNGQATGAAGGGIYIQGSSSPRLENLLVEGSEAAQGGGIYIDSTSGGIPYLLDVHINNTNATGRGGGIYLNRGDLVLERITVTNASANQGGAVYNLRSNTTLSATTLSGNSATNGGAIYNDGGSFNLYNGYVYSNTATSGDGGGLYSKNGTLTVYHNTLFNNQASGSGGHIYQASGGLSVINNILAGGQAATTGGLHRASGTAHHNLYQNNQNGDSNQTLGTGSITGQDPSFINPGENDLHLNLGSPAIDKGDNDLRLPITDIRLPVDFDGNQRPIDQGFDMGADEAGGCFVRIRREPAIIYGVIQDAMSMAQDGDQIDIAGTCRGVQSRQVAGETIQQAVYINKSVTLEGGFNQNFEKQNKPRTFTSTIDALNQGRVAVISGSVVVQLFDLTLTNGQADQGGSFAGLDDHGGGVLNQGQTLNIDGVIFLSNIAANGAGLYNIEGTVTIGNDRGIQTWFGGNEASQDGGGIYNADGIIDSYRAWWFNNQASQQGAAVYNQAQFNGLVITMTDNIAGGNGAGFYNDNNARLTLDRSYLINNQALQGGGLYNQATAALTSYNTILASNKANTNGGGIYNLSPNMQLRHNTLYKNSANGQGGGVYHDTSGTGAIINSNIFFNNSAGTGSGIRVVNAASQFDYNNSFQNEVSEASGGGTGNVLGTDPKFKTEVLFESGYLRLADGSPVEDKADPNSPLIYDLDEIPRPSNQHADIGASEIGGCFVRINGLEPTYGSLQRAADVAASGAELRVAGACRGVQPQQVGGTTLNQTLLLTKNMVIRGGYTDTNDGWAKPDTETNPTLIDAVGQGRLLYVDSTAVISMGGFDLRGGKANNGGAFYVGGGAVVTITSSKIYSHTATSLGGVAYNDGATLTIDGNRIYENSASSQGGVFYHASGVSQIVNNAITENSAPTGAGGFIGGAGGRVWHNTFYKNTATSNGAGVSTDQTSADVRNNIFAEDSGSNVLHSTVAITYDYNNISGASTPYGGSAVAGENASTDDPRMSNPDTGDFSLQSSSSLIDRGDPTMPLTHDYQNELRPGNQGFDLGWDELPGCKARIVRTLTLYGSVQAAIQMASVGDVIQATAEECSGVHAVEISGKTYSQTVSLKRGLTIIGGYDDNFTEPPQSRTILNPGGLGRALLIYNTNAVTIQNFELRDGNASGLGGGPADGNAGGGLYILDSTDINISDTHFLSNTASYGGAVYVDSDSQLVVGHERNPAFNVNPHSSEFINNSADQGGAIYNDGKLWLKETDLTLNTAQQGGGVYNNGSDGFVDMGTRLFNNTATADGAGVYQGGGKLRLWNSMLYRNNAVNGAGVTVVTGTAEIYHNSFHANIATGQGGGVYFSGGNPNIRNNSFDGHEAPAGGAIYGSGGGTVTVDYNNYYNNLNTVGGSVTTGTHALAVEPNYTSSADGNFALREDSLLINAGLDVGVPYDGIPYEDEVPPSPRPINAAPDIGADEYDACLVQLVRTEKIYGSIGSAMIDVQEGDTLRLAMGECQETASVQIDNLTIEGGWPKDFVPPDPLLLGKTTINAQQQGRPMTVDNVAEVYLNNLILTGGQADKGGGLLSRASYLILNGSNIVSNTAVDGGGLYIETGNPVHIDSVDINNNTATNNGGGAYCASGRTLFFGGEIQDNVAAQDGGGLYSATGSEVDMTGGASIARNIAGRHGGGNYVAAAVFSLRNKRFVANSATENGGGFYVAEGGTIFLANLVLINNKGVNGGGIYRDATGLGELQHLTFWGNIASQQGGGIYNAGSELTLNASIMESNVATGTVESNGIQAEAEVSVSYTSRYDNSYAGQVTLGEGNLDDLPTLFFPFSGGELTKNSPVVDAVPNDKSSVPIEEDKDAFLVQRPKICQKDMGAMEFRVWRELLWTTDGSTRQDVPAESSTRYTLAVENNSRQLRGGAEYLLENIEDSGTGYTETIYLTAESSQGWAIFPEQPEMGIFTPTTEAVFDLAPGQIATVTVQVTVPGNSASGETDITNLVARAEYWNKNADSSCVTDEGEDTDTAVIGLTSPNLTTVASADVQVEIGPAQVGSARPGELINYTHFITNVGNSTDTYRLIPKPGLYASALVTPTEVTLSPGESRQLLLSVMINDESASGLTDLSSAIAQQVVDNSNITPVEATVVNQTQILVHNGTRYVLLDGGQDWLQDERQGSLDPTTPLLMDNNCTQPNVAPCGTLAQALSQSQHGDTIKIAAGTYSETIVLTRSVTLQGGHDENNWEANPPDHLQFPTILAPTSGRAVHVHAGQTVGLERLIIQGGTATGLGGGPSGEDVGGNIFHEGDSLEINTSRISGGQATLGGGLYSGAGELIIRNSILHDNQGGAAYMQSGSAWVENSTFFQNQAPSSGSGQALTVGAGSDLTARSNIFANNGENSVLVQAGSRQVTTIDYNLYHGGDSVSGASAGSNQVTADPQFTNSGSNPPNLKPQENSPAIDKGDPTTNVGLMPYDYGNEPRRSGLIPRVDIGAYEFYVERPFEFVTDSDIVAPIGGTVSISHTLSNMTDVADTYTLISDNPQGWIQVPAGQIEVGPQQSKLVVVTVTVPVDVAVGSQDITIITATSQNNSSALGFVIDRTTAGAIQLNLAVNGPTTGQVGLTYQFTARVSPDNVTQPITYTWQATNQTTVINPNRNLQDTASLTWDTPGTKQITVIADNGQSQTTKNHTIVIDQVSTPPLTVTIGGYGFGLIDRNYQFMAEVTPSDAQLPLTYEWTATDQSGITNTVSGLTNAVNFTWSSMGNKTIEVTVSNGQSTAQANFVIALTDQAIPPTSIAVDGITAGVIDTEYEFDATTNLENTTQPVTYTWQASGQAVIKTPRQRDLTVPNAGLTSSANFSWAKAGTHTITATVTNEAGSASTTYAVIITNEPVTPTAVVISGPAAGETNQNYEFTADVSGPTTTQPLTYIWQATDQQEKPQTNNLQDVVTFRWLTAGTKFITVSVTNQTNQAVVDSYEFGVKVANRLTYLPTLLREDDGAATATHTAIPVDTETPVPVDTETPVPGETPTDTPVPVDTATATLTPDRPPVQTATPTPTSYLPDLIVEQFVINNLGNNTYQAEVTVRNVGVAPVSVGNNFYVAIYVDGLNSEPPIFWGAQGSWFDVGQSRTFSQQFSAADIGGSGARQFFAWADPWNDVGESNENNNLRDYGTVTITSLSADGGLRIKPSTGPKPTPTNEP